MRNVTFVPPRQEVQLGMGIFNGTSYIVWPLTWGRRYNSNLAPIGHGDSGGPVFTFNWPNGLEIVAHGVVSTGDNGARGACQGVPSRGQTDGTPDCFMNFAWAPIKWALSTTRDSTQYSLVVPGAVDGVCGRSLGTCSVGWGDSDNGQTVCGTTREWRCMGTNGGSIARCSASNATCPPSPPVEPQPTPRPRKRLPGGCDLSLSSAGAEPLWMLCPLFESGEGK